MKRPEPAAGALALVLTVASAAFGGCSGERSTLNAPAPASTAANAAASPIAAASADSGRTVLTPGERQALVGWWLRYDQKYMIVIDAVAEDGRLSARYLNPDPVGVSKAESWKMGDQVEILVELTDENYPGNFYELSFDPVQQKLVGVYHHLGAREDYEVDFTRFEGEASEAVQPK